MSNYQSHRYVETNTKPPHMRKGFLATLAVCIILMVSFFFIYDYRQSIIHAYNTSIYQSNGEDEHPFLVDRPIIVLGTNYLNQGRIHDEQLHYAALITQDQNNEWQIEEWPVDEPFLLDQTLKGLYDTNKWVEGIKEKIGVTSFYTIHLSLAEMRPLIEALEGIEVEGQRLSELQIMDYIYVKGDEKEQMRRERELIHSLIQQLSSTSTLVQLPYLLEQSTYFIVTDVPYSVVESGIIYTKVTQGKKWVSSLFNQQMMLTFH